MTAIATAPDELRIVQGLRDGDEGAFAELVNRYHASLLRLAMVYVRNRAVAEEVVQETWLGVVQGIERFERRSSLKTWIFRILTNTAKTRAERESRAVPLSSLGDPDDADASAVEPARFLDANHPRWGGHWAAPPSSWREVPEESLLSKETLGCIATAIDELPPVQQQVIRLRDVEGWSASEVCDLLELTEANQRVLLHRARSKVRQALERHLD